jgi:Protein of unknown function (DUF3991)/Toprim-like
MKSQNYLQRTHRLRSIPLESILHLFQAQPDPHDPAKWHTLHGVLSVQGSQFIDWKWAVAGGGAIDLVMHLADYGFTDALQWLERHFPLPPQSTTPADPPTHSPTRPLRLPTPQPSNLWRIRDYLHEQRHIPLNLIESLIASGQLYADGRANAVFLLCDQHHNPVGAELRGTTRRPWRGLASGSQKDRGYFWIGPRHFQAIILCESAIDAISCSTLYSDTRCISTSGARANPPWLAVLINQALPIYCGFDADPTGDRMADAMIDRYPFVQRLRPPCHDWNDALHS